MSPSPAAAELLADLASVFSQRGWRWYVFGAQAVDVWGRPRLSADVDVTLELAGEIPALLEALRTRGFASRISLDDDFIRRTRVVPLVHSGTGMPLDVVLAGPGIEEEFLARAIPVDVGGAKIPFISPEDLLVTKVLAGRPKDLEDIRGILRERGRELDLARVRTSLRILEQALGQSDLLPLFEAQLRASLPE